MFLSLLDPDLLVERKYGSDPSIGHRHGSADPDAYQNVMDPQHTA
jgi:hypothetical protein